MCESRKDRSENKGEDGDKTGGEEDAEESGGVENGNSKGRTRWSQVVARVRLAGGARLEKAEKRFCLLQHTLPSQTVFPRTKFYIIGSSNPTDVLHIVIICHI